MEAKKPPGDSDFSGLFGFTRSFVCDGISSTAAPEATTNPLLDQAGLPKFSSIEPSNLTPAVTSLLENLDKDFAYLTSKISTDSSEVTYDEILPELEKMQFGLGYPFT